VMNGLEDDLNVIVLPSLETKVAGKGHLERGMGSSPCSFLSVSYFKIESFTHKSQAVSYSLWILL